MLVLFAASLPFKDFLPAFLYSRLFSSLKWTLNWRRTRQWHNELCPIGSKVQNLIGHVKKVQMCAHIKWKVLQPSGISFTVPCRTLPFGSFLGPVLEIPPWVFKFSPWSQGYYHAHFCHPWLLFRPTFFTYVNPGYYSVLGFQLRKSTQDTRFNELSHPWMI